MTGPTQFTESNALLAIIDDPDEARAIVVGSMLPHERLALARQAAALAELCYQVDREYAAAHGTCTAIKGCAAPSVGYFHVGRTTFSPYGVCAGHRTGVEDRRNTVHEMPEVVL